MAKQKQEEKAARQPLLEKVERINRSAAANRVVAAIDGKTTLSELAAKADAAFVAGGGKADVRSASYYVKRALETAESLGVLRLTRPTDIMVEKAK